MILNKVKNSKLVGLHVEIIDYIESFIVFILTCIWQNWSSANRTSTLDMIHPTIQTILMESMRTICQASNLVITLKLIQANCTTFLQIFPLINVLEASDHKEFTSHHS